MADRMLGTVQVEPGSPTVLHTERKITLRGSAITSVVIDQCFLAILYTQRYAHTYIHTLHICISK